MQNEKKDSHLCGSHDQGSSATSTGTNTREREFLLICDEWISNTLGYMNSKNINISSLT